MIDELTEFKSVLIVMNIDIVDIKIVGGSDI